MKRVLIVEDEALMARMLARVLREEGYAAETAEDDLGSHAPRTSRLTCSSWTGCCLTAAAYRSCGA